MFTTRKRNCGKVMFSEVRVCSQGVTISGPMSFPGLGGYLWYKVPWGGVFIQLSRGYGQGAATHPLPRVGMSRGCSPSPDTWVTVGYGQQAGGIHPTGMLSCHVCICYIICV